MPDTPPGQDAGTPHDRRRDCPRGAVATSALFVDLYELTMAQAYLESGVAERPATFSLFARSLPPGWGYLVAAGTEEAVAALAGLGFSDADLRALEATGALAPSLLERLRSWRFRGRVRALAEGTPFGPRTPLLEVDAPLIDAQLVESLLLNAVHAQSLVAAKASRCVEAARGRLLVDFSMRRDHGPSAALAVARASHIAGFAATSNVLAAVRYGIPSAGTMAHSFVEVFPDEAAAFEAFARSFPDGPILLVDTYDTVAGVRRAIATASRLRARGHRLGGVRLDSGDIGALAVQARALLDAAGERDATVFASGGLDEHRIARLVDEGAPIDGFGVGTLMGVSADAPYLDMAYKLVAFDGRPTMKLSSGKATLPGPKQVWRRMEGGTIAEDVLARADEGGPDGAEPLLEVVMEEGRPGQGAGLAAARARLAAARARLAPEQRALAGQPLPVRTSDALEARRRETEDLVRRLHGLGPRKDSLPG